MWQPENTFFRQQRALDARARAQIVENKWNIDQTQNDDQNRKTFKYLHSEACPLENPCESKRHNGEFAIKCNSQYCGKRLGNTPIGENNRSEQKNRAETKH